VQPSSVSPRRNRAKNLEAFLTVTVDKVHQTRLSSSIPANRVPISALPGASAHITGAARVPGIPARQEKSRVKKTLGYFSKLVVGIVQRAATSKHRLNACKSRA